MKRTFLLFCLVSCCVVPGSFAETIRGVVRDTAGQPVANASILAGGKMLATTASDGRFVADVPDGTADVRVSRSGFLTETVAVIVEPMEVTLRPSLAESIVVSGIRADVEIPVTKTNITREEIVARYHGQDIPLLLRDTPSINAYAESGVGGSGYSYITLRGVSPTRINFTIDGVPLADSEDMGTYFADFPDLARSLESIQIQRGVGTSTVGSPSFGGSINFQSIDLAPAEEIDAEVAAGSFGGRLATVGYQSGFLPGGIALYSRLSYNESDGFRESSGIRQHNLFMSAAKQGQHSQWRLTGFTAHEDQQLAFFATDEDTLKQDLRFNPQQPEERDSFGYDLAQLQYLRALSDNMDMTASVYYQRGYGSYRLYDDSASRTGLRQYGLDGLLIGSLLTLGHSGGHFSTSYGVHVNRFEREHTRDLVDVAPASAGGGSRDYFNYGVKGEANAFAKLRYDRGPVHLYSDGQVRHTDFRYHGDVAIDPKSWTFFNPRFGARYDTSPQSSVYVSAGRSTREPTRNDLFQGQDNPSARHDLDAVRPERVTDFEAGWNYGSVGVGLAANVYAMEFRNEIASTGELSDIGLLLRRNVDRSYRRGIEIEADWRPRPSLRLQSSVNVSRNRIDSWTQFYDVYADDGSYLTSRPLVHRDVAPLLTPSPILSQSVDYSPSRAATIGVVVRHVGESFLDNTNNAGLVAPAFTTTDLSASLDLSRWMRAGSPRLAVQVNNLFNNDRVFPSGYSYQYFAGEELTGISYYYPQAGRHVVVRIGFRL